MTLYTKNGITVEAIQWTGQNYCDVMDFFGVQDPEPIEEQSVAVIRLVDDEDGGDDADGEDINIGDWVICHPHGRFEVIPLEDFDYEPVEDLSA